MLREAKIMVPVNSNDGRAIPAVTKEAFKRMLTVFGGATLRHGCFGGWIDPKDGKAYQEPMVEIISAMTIDTFAHAALIKIAEYVAVAADQKAVYVCHADGEVQFVEQPAPLSVAA